ncbi:UNVERIFIED_ORG: FKBP-type peptidyl-prolyl cis-trans isomerase, partial [Rahnella aquatilis]
MNSNRQLSRLAAILGAGVMALSAGSYLPCATAADAPASATREPRSLPATGSLQAARTTDAPTPSTDAAGVTQGLTPEQVNEMLSNLRMQVAQQNALLQMLAERSGGAGVSAVPPVGAAPAQTPAATAVSAPASPETATAALPAPVAMVPPVPVAPPAPAGGAAVPAQPVQPVPDARAENVKKAYASGVSVWREIQRSVDTQRALGIRLDTQEVLAGIQDSANGSSLRYSEQDLTAALSSLNQDFMTRAAGERENQRIDGKVYRQEFSKAKGVKSDAGSWYQVLSRGTGRNLSTSDVVSLTVTGTLPDGTVFDASGQSGQTKTARVGALMPAVAIGLQKIARGGHIKVVVPPEKGYGDAGLPPTIPGGATLIFDIQVA